jgi:hypothetical protein
MFSLILAVGFAVDLPVRVGSCSGGQCSAVTVEKKIEKKVEITKTSRSPRIKGRFKRSCS